MATELSFTQYTKTVGTSAVQVTSTATAAPRGILVKAGPGNTGTVSLGTANTVTVSSADNTDGYPLSAGQEVVLPLNDLSDVWCIASAASQKVHAIVI